MNFAEATMARIAIVLSTKDRANEIVAVVHPVRLALILKKNPIQNM